jgi:hypothetical protein
MRTLETELFEIYQNKNNNISSQLWMEINLSMIDKYKICEVVIDEIKQKIDYILLYENKNKIISNEKN